MNPNPRQQYELEIQDTVVCVKMHIAYSFKIYFMLELSALTILLVYTVSLKKLFQQFVRHCASVKLCGLKINLLTPLFFPQHAPAIS